MNSKTFNQIKIIFFGTPQFAVASLEALIKAGLDVVAVVTAPDKPSGRGLQMQSTPVKVFANQKNILVLQPEKLKNPDFLLKLKELNADLHIVVAFRMLPQSVWEMPLMGTINVHGSLLPQYRGAAPINWAIINGATETGVTTFKLKHEIDTGNILMSRKVAILDEDNAGTIHDKLMITGAELLVETVIGLTQKTLKETPQSILSEDIKHAPKLFKKDMEINWDNESKMVLNHIRGLSPYPTAFSTINGKTIKIYNAEIIQKIPTVLVGEYETDNKNYLRFATKDGYINILELQQEGKKKLDIETFLRGFRNV